MMTMVSHLLKYCFLQFFFLQPHTTVIFFHHSSHIHYTPVHHSTSLSRPTPTYIIYHMYTPTMPNRSKDNGLTQERTIPPVTGASPVSEEMPQGPINVIPPRQATDVSVPEASANARPQATESRGRQAHLAHRPHPRDQGHFHGGPRRSRRGVITRPASVASPSRLPIAESYNLFRNETIGAASQTLWALDLARAAPDQTMQSNIHQPQSNAIEAQRSPRATIQTSDQPANQSTSRTGQEYWILMAHPDIAPLRARVLELDQRYANRRITDPDIAPIWADRLALVDQIRSRMGEVRRQHGHVIREEARRRDAPARGGERGARQPQLQPTHTTSRHGRSASARVHSIVYPPDLARDLQEACECYKILRKYYPGSSDGVKRPGANASRILGPSTTGSDLNIEPEVQASRKRPHQVSQNDPTIPRDHRSYANRPEYLRDSPRLVDNPGTRPAASTFRAPQQQDLAEVPVQQSSDYRVPTQQSVEESTSAPVADQVVQREAIDVVSVSSEVVTPHEEHTSTDTVPSPVQSQPDVHVSLGSPTEVVAGTAVEVTVLPNQTPIIITIHDSRNASGEVSRHVQWDTPLVAVSHPHPEHPEGAYLEQTVQRPRTPFSADELSPVADDGNDESGDYSEYLLIDLPDCEDSNEVGSMHSGSDQWAEVWCEANARMRLARRED